MAAQLVGASGLQPAAPQPTLFAAPAVSYTTPAQAMSQRQPQPTAFVVRPGGVVQAGRPTPNVAVQQAGPAFLPQPAHRVVAAAEPRQLAAAVDVAGTVAHPAAPAASANGEPVVQYIAPNFVRQDAPAEAGAMAVGVVEALPARAPVEIKPLVWDMPKDGNRSEFSELSFANAVKVVGSGTVVGSLPPVE
mmetsp:Transcript_19014/g.34356  ORF Transcript_19014/g.34356 Transcript_19014/m.34356 type:complete len:191 (+) Transcript_19014:50-622(+)